VDFQILCVPHGSIKAEHVAVVREVMEFTKIKGKALQKAMVAPPWSPEAGGMKDEAEGEHSVSRFFNHR
jgi:hypothetical protein